MKLERLNHRFIDRNSENSVNPVLHEFFIRKLFFNLIYAIALVTDAAQFNCTLSNENQRTSIDS